jgi:hypothetical protein
MERQEISAEKSQHRLEHDFESTTARSIASQEEREPRDELDFETGQKSSTEPVFHNCK